VSQRDDIRPFLPIVASPTRPLGAALHNVVTAPVTSPWLPRNEAEPAAAGAATPGPVGPSVAELTAMFDEARDQGRAEGLAETAELRARLTRVLDELAAARAQLLAPAAELVTDVASCVIEAWLESSKRSELFAPIVRGWIARSAGQPATARVHPDDVAALTEAIGDAIGDAQLTIAPDPAMAPGTLEIANPTLELSHDWRARLPDLRTAIAGALSGGEP
jgi:flagellar biosynthesis/type III secretory pathway protein FliH